MTSSFGTARKSISSSSGHRRRHPALLPLLPLLLLLLLLLLLPPSAALLDDDGGDDDGGDDGGSEGTSYARYARYPPYCSIPNEMDTRHVPPLPPPPSTSTSASASTSTSSYPSSSRLVHVTALIRHGARTPYEGPPGYECWDGYWTDPNTGVWDCDLRTYTGPPASTKERGDTSDSGGPVEEEPDFLFEKRYDALLLPPGGGKGGGGGGRGGNVLNGTCQLGQLLARGYDQELRNGDILRRAYFYDGGDDDDETTGRGGAGSDPRMRLWDSTTTTGGGGGGDGETDQQAAATRAVVGDAARPPYLEPNLRYRADDEQRTLMSGQVLLRGLFERELLLAAAQDDGGGTAIVRLHTADYDSDVLTPNPRKCPRTRDLFEEAYGSDEYRRWAEGDAAEREYVLGYVGDRMMGGRGGGDDGGRMPGSMLDCMMTTMCTDRILPEYLDDYDGGLGPTPFFLAGGGEEGGGGGGASSSGGGADGGGGGEGGGARNMFERILNLAVKNFTFAYKYNDAAFPKLGMGPLWSEIMTNILPIVDPTNHPSSSSSSSSGTPPPPKLGLFSGHDTTLMPILATLGDKVWPGTEWAPYASMVLIEIHEINATAHQPQQASTAFPSGYAFRLIYNGEVLTSRMDGCDSELCDSLVLVERVRPFAKPYDDAECASPSSSSSSPSTPTPPDDGDLMTEMERATRDMLVAPGGAWAMALLVISSVVLGGVLMWFLMRQERRKYERGGRDGSVMGLSMRVMSDEDDDGRRNFRSTTAGSSGIDSAVSAAHHEDEKKSFDIDENELI